MKTGNIVLQPQTRLGPEGRQYHLKSATVFAFAGVDDDERKKAIISIGDEAVYMGERALVWGMAQHRINEGNNAFLSLEADLASLLEIAQADLGSITIKNALAVIDDTVERVERIRIVAQEGDKVRVINVRYPESEKSNLKAKDPATLIEAIERKF